MGTRWFGSERKYTLLATRRDRLPPMHHTEFGDSLPGFLGDRPRARVICIVVSLVLVCAVISGASIGVLWSLPTANPDTVMPRSLFSGHAALSTVQRLVQEIGPRPIGSRELFNDTAELIVARLESFRDAAVQRGYAVPLLVSSEVGAGAFLASPELAAVYRGVRNVYFTIGDTSAEALVTLFTAKCDSPFVGPGASSDASGVAVLLEAVRAFLHEEPPSLASNTAIVVAFLGGQLGRGAHLAGTRYAGRVASFVDVDSLGAGGPATLFQASSNWMVNQVRWCGLRSGSSLLMELEQWGMLDSGVSYGPLRASSGAANGASLAWWQSGYVHRTSYDNMVHVSASSLQDMGDVVLCLLRRLGTRVRTAPSDDDRYTAPVFVDFARAGLFNMPHSNMLAFAYSIVVVAALAIGVLLCASAPYLLSQGPVAVAGDDSWPVVVRWHVLWLLAGTLNVVLMVAVGALVVALVGGFFVWLSPFAWYRSAALPIVVFLVPFLLAAGFTQWLFELFAHVPAWRDDHSTWRAQRYTQFGAVIVTLVATAAVTPYSQTLGFLLCWCLCGQMLGMLVGVIVSLAVRLARGDMLRKVDLWWLEALVFLVVVLPIVAEHSVVVMEVLVPALGRAGSGVPEEGVHTIGLVAHDVPMRPEVLLALIVCLFASLIVLPMLSALHAAVMSKESPVGDSKHPLALMSVVLVVVSVLVLLLALVPPYSISTPQRLQLSHTLAEDGVQGNVTRLTETISSLDARSMFQTLVSIVGSQEARDRWVCRSRRVCSTRLPPAAPALALPTIAFQRVGLSGDSVVIEVDVSTMASLFTSVVVRGTVYNWTLTSTLPQCRARQTGVVANVVLGFPARGESLTFQIRASALRDVDVVVRTHSRAFSPELTDLYTHFPNWAVTDPNGNFVSTERRVRVWSGTAGR